MQHEIADRIYEAAFLPEFWPEALAQLAHAAGAASGEFLTFSRSGEPLYKASSASRKALFDWIEGGQWRECEKPRLYMERSYQGFRLDSEVLTQTELARDPANSHLARYGLGGQVASIIRLPTGDLGCFTFERWLRDGPANQRMVDILDTYRPHLSRAAIIAARLELQQARAVISALALVGVPAAVLTAKGNVISVNSLLEAMSDAIRAEAFGAIGLNDIPANDLLKTAIGLSANETQPSVRSIAVPGKVGALPFIVHVLPLRRNARDLFSGGEMVLAVTTVSASGGAPAPSILSALFDLTPTEARLAAGLVEGRALRDVAAAMNVTYSTARTYLSRVFVKTGTGQQSELVALLKGTNNLGTHQD